MDLILYYKPLKMEITANNLKIDDKEHKASIRTIGDMKEAFAKASEATKEPLYYMYRSIKNAAGLRYDVTVIMPKLTNGEYAKTFGHYHPKSANGIEYPEVYQVLSGEAKFILQKKNPDESVDVIVVSAKEKEIVLFPPAYGHVSVNVSDRRPLVLANIVCDNFESDYSDYKKNRGAAVYYMDSGINQNTKYIVKKIEQLKGSEINNRYGFVCSDLLEEFVKNPKKFEFLKKPAIMFR